MADQAIFQLLEHGREKVFKNLPPARLVELSIMRGEGQLAANGALVVRTGERTGRSPNDRFVVEEKWSKKNVWWGPVNKPVSPEIFERLFLHAVDYLKNRERFVFECFAGADQKYRIPVRVITERAWHTLFATTLFVRPTKDELQKIKPEFTVIDVPGLVLEPARFNLCSGTFIGISFEKKIILIIGTGYGGEIKKSVFAIMNGFLPDRNVFPMHCSANVGELGDVALFFGLSGTGKTTLSADPLRRLIGDDEHGWSDNGVFNFEGGCYAKVIKLSREVEPQIYDAIRFGSVLENVILDKDTLVVDYNADKITENTRATYPVEHIPNCLISGEGPHPKHVFFLTCDAFGVLPPIAKLSPEMAMYHFLSGYTAKIAGTEIGVDEPQATFSTCFGAPFLPLHPTVYSKLLGTKLAKYGTKCWLVNSGWSGGAYGEGSRMKVQIARALITAALMGKLDDVKYTLDPVFNVYIPNSCPGVDSNVLTPKNTWHDKSKYERKAHELAERFVKNFEQYKDYIGDKVVKAGPRL